MKLPFQWTQMAILLLSIIILIMTIIFMENEILLPQWGSLIIIILIGIIFYLFYVAYKTYQHDSIKKLVLIGFSGVGKTSTYNYLQCKNVSSQQGFTIGTSGELGIVDTPDFDLETDFDIREIRIKQFQQFFIKYQNSIRTLLLVVNFERTDLMKQKINKTLKFLIKFNCKFSLLITNFELSENQFEDETNLKQAFNFYHFQKILFVDKNKNNSELKQELIQILQDTPQQQLNLQDTIFEIIQKKEQQKIMEQIFHQSQQKKQQI
ncbi:unnamed protein product [Paramecium primaurelia]|uniref:Uncharacterized protein n=1 Tax=Paramecium primaurelia TaxID=5886 RepID=A0A8S1P7F6_PARPR|nr:unnamed protein product [Paramecium primaurelia]